MKYRTACPNDASVCVDILRDWIAQTDWMPMLHSRASMIAFFAHRIAAIEGWVALRQDGKVVGFCLRDHDVVTALYIDAAVQRSGFGSGLLQLAMQDRTKLELWILAQNEPAKAFYHKAGFCAVGGTQGDNEEGLPDIKMCWQAS
ncbi:MAG: GNAT family N-acetyltransferase [Pseudoruegeria sp.]